VIIAVAKRTGEASRFGGRLVNIRGPKVPSRHLHGTHLIIEEAKITGGPSRWGRRLVNIRGPGDPIYHRGS